MSMNPISDAGGSPNCQPPRLFGIKNCLTSHWIDQARLLAGQWATHRELWSYFLSKEIRVDKEMAHRRHSHCVPDVETGRLIPSLVSHLIEDFARADCLSQA